MAGTLGEPGSVRADLAKRLDDLGWSLDQLDQDPFTSDRR